MARRAKNHSIAALVPHLLFWNDGVLIKFKEDTLPDFNGNKKNELSIFIQKLPLGYHEVESYESSLSIKHQNRFNKKVERLGIRDFKPYTAYHTEQLISVKKHNGCGLYGYF